MAEEILTPFDRLKIIRHRDRPTIKDYLPLIFTDFFEMRCHKRAVIDVRP